MRERGVAGDAGWELDVGAESPTQQLLLPQSQWEQRACAFTERPSPGRALCARASDALNKMAKADFTHESLFFFVLASASSIFLMYLAVSFLKSLRQSLQQNLISRPSCS